MICLAESVIRRSSKNISVCVLKESKIDAGRRTVVKYSGFYISPFLYLAHLFFVTFIAFWTSTGQEYQCLNKSTAHLEINKSSKTPSNSKLKTMETENNFLYWKVQIPELTKPSFKIPEILPQQRTGFSSFEVVRADDANRSIFRWPSYAIFHILHVKIIIRLRFKKRSGKREKKKKKMREFLKIKTKKSKKVFILIESFMLFVTFYCFIERT